MTHALAALGLRDRPRRRSTPHRRDTGRSYLEAFFPESAPWSHPHV